MGSSGNSKTLIALLLSLSLLCVLFEGRGEHPGPGRLWLAVPGNSPVTAPSLTLWASTFPSQVLIPASPECSTLFKSTVWSLSSFFRWAGIVILERAMFWSSEPILEFFLSGSSCVCWTPSAPPSAPPFALSGDSPGQERSQVQG